VGSDVGGGGDWLVIVPGWPGCLVNYFLSIKPYPVSNTIPQKL